MPTSHLAVVGDVGGTHARFGLADLSRPVLEIERPLTFLCADHESGHAALRAYLDRLGMTSLPPAVAIAVAGPVVDGAMSFTNMSWRLSESGLKAFGFRRAALINDYGAQGGVYIAGGIAPRLLDVLKSSTFRPRFEAKGRFRDYLAAIPTRVVTYPYMALLGAAYALVAPSLSPP
jgi:glucokinase